MNSSLVKTEKAIFAAGCFWGIEHPFQKAKGVILTAAGYIGGTTTHPTYMQVCSGQTGHAEAVEVVFDPSETLYETLAKLFFEIHNPALINKESNGKRSQYRSAIFYLSNEQKLIAGNLVELLKNKKIKVGTEITPAAIFYKAEEYHQGYYNKNGKVDDLNSYKQKF